MFSVSSYTCLESDCLEAKVSWWLSSHNKLSVSWIYCNYHQCCKEEAPHRTNFHCRKTCIAASVGFGSFLPCFCLLLALSQITSIRTFLENMSSVQSWSCPTVKLSNGLQMPILGIGKVSVLKTESLQNKPDCSNWMWFPFEIPHLTCSLSPSKAPPRLGASVRRLFCTPSETAAYASLTRQSTMALR